MDVKVLFDKLNIIDGVKDDFTVKVILDEDVFSVKVVSTSPSEKKMYAKADAIENFASGSIASFPDGANGVPMNSLIANIVPIQSLNGYANPWPAGGGKNKLENLQTTQTISGVKFTVNPDGSVLVDGTATALIVFTLNDHLEDYLENNASYCLNGSPTNSDISKWKLRVFNISDKIDTGTGVDFTFKSVGDERKCDIVVYSGTTMNNLLFKPMIRRTDVSDATFAPYSNICPISGRTGLSVYRTGVNVWDEQWELGSINGSGGNQNANDRIRSKNYIPVTPGATYYYYINSTYGIFTWGYDSSKTYVGRVPANGWAISNNTVTIPNGVYYIRIVVQPGYGTTYNNDISINYPSNDTEYHSHTGTTYAVDWTSEAGTVYGGTLDVVTGVLTVDRAMVDLGTLTWGFSTTADNVKCYYSNGISTLIKHVASHNDTPDMISSKYKTFAWNSRFSVTNGVSLLASGHLRIIDSNYQSESALSDFTASLSGVQLCYELATPITYQLSPQEVKTLFGQNCIWSDSGDVFVDYTADTKKYIDNKILQAIVAALNA